MRTMAKKLAPHALWLSVCLAVVLFYGASPSNKDSEPLTRNSIAKVAAKTLPAVVSIQVNHEIESMQGGGNPLKDLPEELKPFKDFFKFYRFRTPNQIPDDEMFEKDEQGRLWMPMAGGSGVLIRKDGYIVTNRHVVEGAKDNDKINIIVTLHQDPDKASDQPREFSRSKGEVKIVGVDILRDLAVLKIDAKRDLPYLGWGDSDTLRIGDWVVAVGNPLELEGTASEGIVSQKHRQINKAAIEDLLQTTAMINPGNSGGALVDLDGDLIGINMAIATNTGRWQGVGFAIPSKQAKWVTDSIIKEGRVIQGYLGVTMSRETLDRMSQQTMKYYKLPKAEGVLLEVVVKDGPAAKAGLKKDDAIVSLKINDKEYPTKDNGDLLTAVASQPIDTKADIIYYRDGEKKTTSVTLTERPKDEKIAEMMKTPEERKGEIKRIGITVKSREGDEPGLDVIKVEPGSPAAKAEPMALKEGDIIKEIEDTATKTADDAQQALKGPGKDGMFKVRFFRGDREYMTYLDLGSKSKPKSK
ncbi:MAG: trypsin-like peptidase domain-containing protein [Candidatus Sumerlaeota bacterium]|nr:trypsin-like peptidase domain-containing protein [Candidatus Sumerlaeota bacterium]